jgi:O-antigen ligase
MDYFNKYSTILLTFSLGVLFSFGLELVFLDGAGNLTLILTVISICIVLFLIFKEIKFISLNKTDIALLFYVVIILIGSIFSDSVEGAITYFAYSVVFYFIGRFVFLRSNKSSIILITLFSLPIIYELLVRYNTLLETNVLRVSLADGTSPIGIGEMLSFFIISSYYVVRFVEEHKITKLFFIAGILIGLFEQIAVLSSRGATISVIITIVVTEFIFGNKKFVGLIVVVSAGAYYLFNIFIDSIAVILPIANRFSFQSIMNDPSVIGSSLYVGRAQLVTYALEKIGLHPFFGNGFGSVYPHNILIEIFASAGILGLLLFLVFLLSIFWNLNKKNTNYLYFMLFLVALINRMTSFEYSMQKPLFLFAGIMVSQIHLRNKMKFEFRT